MSLSLIVAFFVILAFVAGVALLFRGYASLPNEKTAPAGELEKVQSDLKTANHETEKLRAQANTLAVQLEEMKGKFLWAEGNVKSLEDTLRKSSQAYARLDQLEKDLSFLSQKADSQAREAIDVITRLAAETEVLRLQQSAAPEPAPAVDVSALTDENQKLQIQLDGYVRKLKDLETAVAAAQGEAEQFKTQQAQRVQELQAHIAQMETESKTAQPPVEEASDVSAVDTSAIEEELRRVRIQSEEKIIQANAALVKFNSEMEMLNSQITDKDTRLKKLTEDLYSTREELSASLRTVNELKQSQGVKAPMAGTELPDTEKAELQKRLYELGAANQRLLDKEKILTYKLTQSRAQALSLERLCDELKEQAGVILK